MKNLIKQSLSGVMVQLVRAEAGATEYAVNINMKHMLPAVIRGCRLALVQADDELDAGRDELRARRMALAEATAEARGFAMLARDIFMPILGGEYSEAWDATGYVGSLETPRNANELLVLMQKLTSFLVANPAREVEPCNITALQGGTVMEMLRGAICGVDSQLTEVDRLQTERDEKFVAARKCLRDLVHELEMLLAPLDRRWLGFGLNMPGADETPDAPENVVVQIVNAQQVQAIVPPVARAERYRAFMRVKGTEAEFTPIATVYDSLFVFDDLPVNTEIELAFTAANDGGESPLSEVIVVKTALPQSAADSPLSGQ